MAKSDDVPQGDSKAERSEATRSTLVRVARQLFAERGYAAVGTEEIVERAGLTRGALYHHFDDKRDLFRAVYKETEEDVVDLIRQGTSRSTNANDLLVAGISVFLDACTDPALVQIGLLDGPSVLGWQECRDIAAASGLGLLTFALQSGMDAGVLRRTEVQPLAHLMLGALEEAAMLIANAEDRTAARSDMEKAVGALIAGMRTG
jgi:AcrR family transcriptional regulator